MAKSFRNVTDAFITTPAAEAEHSAPPAGFKRNPEFVETRSRRVITLLPPSVADQLKTIAAREGTSTNEIINRALAEYVARNK